MNHRTTRQFWDRYNTLNPETQRIADANFQLLKTNSRHPSLQFKRVGRFWSVRVGLHYRAIAVEDGDDVVWFWIGHHSQYDRLVSQR